VATFKDPHAVLVTNMECELVREAIRQLPDDAREIILLREYEDLSYQEIADLLDCPLGTVMSRLGRARSRLRILISQMEQSNSWREQAGFDRPSGLHGESRKARTTLAGTPVTECSRPCDGEPETRALEE
jgi:hypothetical protein